VRRRLITILIFLLAGAVVNVAVAWGIVWKTDWSFLPGTWQASEGLPWPRDVPTHWPDMAKLSHRAKGFGMRVLLYGAQRPPNPWKRGPRTTEETERMEEESTKWKAADREEFVIWTYRAGWPMVALGWESWGEVLRHGLVGRSQPPGPGFTLRTGGHPPRSNWWVWGIPVQLSTSEKSMLNNLPIRPLWPGFVVNTLFYAASLWLLICGPFALRRFVRMRRGLCPKCAYPMGEAAVCTECGKPLPKRAVV
jgi:hypothetical protein